jgi:hypothetical protein
MISLEAVVYFLCFVSSALCACLLSSAFSRQKERLLLWSSLCFWFLALNNFLVFADIILLPDLNLIPFRAITALAATGILLYGFIWEIE